MLMPEMQILPGMPGTRAVVRVRALPGIFLNDLMRLIALPILLGCALLLTVSPLYADRIEATNSTFASVDGDTRTTPPDFTAIKRNVTFTGAELDFGSGIIEDVNITIDFSKLSDNVPPFPPQPWYSEIGFALKSPNGTIVELIPIGTFLDPFDVPFIFDNTPGFDGIVTLDDAAAAAVNNGTIAGRPNAGTFRPINALSAFNGENALGTWELWIEDSISVNPLLFNSMTLSIQTAAIVPEPGSWVLGGLSLVSLMGYAWRKRRVS